MVRIALLATSASESAGPDGTHSNTGAWMEEIAAPYYIFRSKGWDVDLVSISGGEIPIDPASLGGDFATADVQRWLKDPTAKVVSKYSIGLEEVAPTPADFVDSYDAMYMSGGHGTCTDYPTSETLKACIEGMYAAGKIVAADCHGPICLAVCNKPDGSPLVAGHEVTGFTDAEEAAVGLTGKVPFLIESKFKEQGGQFNAAADWQPNVVVSDNLITGQNPASSTACANAVVEKLSATE